MVQIDMKSKIIPLLIGTHMLATACCTTIYEKDEVKRHGGMRNVSVKVAYDEEYAHKAKNRAHIAIVEKASKSLEEQVGIRLVIKGESYWDSDDCQKSMYQARKELESEVGHESENGKCEILIGFTGQGYEREEKDETGKTRTFTILGIAEGIGTGNSILVWGDYEFPGRVTIHELGHLLGAEHTAELSVMREEPACEKLDEKNKEIILKNKFRWFYE